MKTSVIIPSYNPTQKLPETLERLLPQADLIDELIIIIDNNSYTDFAKSLLEKYAASLKMKIFPQENSGRGKSRNRGVELASGDLIIFLDDDMLAENGLIEKHIQYHIKNPGAIVSGNGYRNPKEANYDFGKFLIQMETGWKQNAGDVSEVTLQKFNFTACNMSLPKSVLKELNGFDTRFSDGEDFDFAVRAINKGIPVMYDISLLAWHNDWPGIDTYIRRQNEYTAAKMDIVNAHPEYLQYFPNLKSVEGSKAKKIRASILRKTIGKWTISKNILFRILPLKMKFLFFNLTISAFSSINR